MRTPETPVARHSTRTASARILLVDDSEANLLALESCLEELGETLVRAKGAQEALRALLKEEFALVLLDVRMPEMDGFELARFIRQQGRLKDLPLIFISALEPRQEELELAYELGVVDFVVKPVTPLVLQTKARVFVELYRSRTDLARRVAERTAELEKAALTLRTSEARLRLLVDQVPAVQWTTDADLRITMSVGRGLAVLGLKPGQLVGTLLPDAVGPDDPAVAGHRRALAGESASYEGNYAGRKFETYVEPLRDERGTVIGVVGLGFDQTERRAAERELAYQHELTRGIAEKTADPIFMTDERGRATYANPEAVRVFGFTLDELRDQALHDAIHHHHPDGRPFPMAECPLGQVYGEGRTLRRHEDVFFRKDGTAVPVLCSNSPLEIDGRRVGALLVIHDLTEQKRARVQMAEELATMTRLQEVSARLVRTGEISELLGEILGAAIDVTGADMGNIQLLEGEVLRIVTQRGFEAPFLEFFGTVHGGQAACGLALSSGERVIAEDVATSPVYDESSRNAMLEAGARACQSTPLLSRAGRLLGILSTHYREPRRPNERALRLLDILSRQAADLLERAESERSLRESREELALDLEATRSLQEISARMIRKQSPESLYEEVVEAARTIMRSDFASIQMLHPERGEGGELRLLAFRGFNPEAAKFWEWVKPASESTCGIALRTGGRVVVPDVERCPFMAGSEDLATYLGTGIRAVQSTPLLSREGRLLGMISTHWRSPHTPSDRDLRLFDVLARQAADLIERSQALSEVLRVNDDLERRVGERTASLEEMIRELNTFAYTVAHDLRAPLRALHQYSDLLLEDHGAGLDREGVEYLRRIAQGATRMDTLILDLLSYSRIARADIKLGPVDVSEVISKVLADLDPELLKKRSKVKVQGAAVKVAGDSTLLSQSLSNLVLNAIKFVPPGTDPEVVISAEVKGDRVRLTVSDRGIGIPFEHQSRLFKVFERLHRDDAYPGTGIGLAIVKKAAERMNGRVGVESEPGKGSTFWVELFKEPE